MQSRGHTNRACPILTTQDQQFNNRLGAPSRRQLAKTSNLHRFTVLSNESQWRDPVTWHCINFPKPGLQLRIVPKNNRYEAQQTLQTKIKTADHLLHLQPRPS